MMLRTAARACCCGRGDRPMFRVLQARTSRPARVSRRWVAGIAAGSTLLLAACSGGYSPSDLISNFSSTPAAAPGTTIGAGQVKVGLILPLSASGNAGVAAQSMRNAAEMALAEFNSPNIQLLVKEDGGSASGAQQAAQQVLAEG